MRAKRHLLWTQRPRSLRGRRACGCRSGTSHRWVPRERQHRLTAARDREVIRARPLIVSAAGAPRPRSAQLLDCPGGCRGVGQHRRHGSQRNHLECRSGPDLLRAAEHVGLGGPLRPGTFDGGFVGIAGGQSAVGWMPVTPRKNKSALIRPIASCAAAPAATTECLNNRPPTIEHLDRRVRGELDGDGGTVGHDGRRQVLGKRVAPAASAVVPPSTTTVCPGRTRLAASRPTSTLASVLMPVRMEKSATAGEAGERPAVHAVQPALGSELPQVAADRVLRTGRARWPASFAITRPSARRVARIRSLRWAASTASSYICTCLLVFARLCP